MNARTNLDHEKAPLRLMLERCLFMMINDVVWARLNVLALEATLPAATMLCGWMRIDHDFYAGVLLRASKLYSFLDLI